MNKGGNRTVLWLTNILLSFNRSGDYQAALLDWENVLGLEPMGYMSDRGSQISQIYQVAAFNIACCYSKMGEVTAGLEALEEALKSGYEDYDKIRCVARRGVGRPGTRVPRPTLQPPLTFLFIRSLSPTECQRERRR